MTENTYELNDKERVKIEKYKVQLDRYDDLCEKNRDMSNNYMRDLMMLDAKYLDLISPLKSQCMRLYAEMDKLMTDVWKSFKSRYEGSHDLEDLEIDFDNLVVKVSEDEDEDEEEHEKWHNKGYGQCTSAQEEALKRLFGENTNLED